MIIDNIDTLEEISKLKQMEKTSYLANKEVRVKYLEGWILKKDSENSNYSHEFLNRYKNMCDSHYDFPVSEIINDVEAAMKNVYGWN